MHRRKNNSSRDCKSHEKRRSVKVLRRRYNSKEKITKKIPGEVKVDGKRWTAVADENINPDETVEILEINSTKLKVKRMEE